MASITSLARGVFDSRGIVVIDPLDPQSDTQQAVDFSFVGAPVVIISSAPNDDAIVDEIWFDLVATSSAAIAGAASRFRVASGQSIVIYKPPGFQRLIARTRNIAHRVWAMEGVIISPGLGAGGY